MLSRFIAALVLAASMAPVLRAQEGDPLKSDACKAALGVLEQVAAEPASKAKAARVAAARKDAAAACLGRSDDRRARSGAPDPVQAVPPPVVAAPARPTAAPDAALPTPALQIPRPIVITTCDPAGCWDSEGRRLNSMGPLLMGPRGPCTLQGGLANCP